MKKSLWNVLAVPTLAFALAGCGASDSSSAATGAGKKVRVAFLNGISGNSYTQAVAFAAEAQAMKMGAEMEVLGTPNDAAKQIAQMQDAITSRRFDAFVVLPVDGNSLVPVTRQATGAGIKVVAAFNTISRDIGSVTPGVPGMVAAVGEPMTANGKAIGDDVVGACKGKSPCEVVYLPGSIRQATESIRTKAVREVLSREPGIKVVAHQEGGYLQASALKVTTDILAVHRGVDVIATSGDQMTLGAERAVKNAGLTGKVKLIGNAASMEGVRAVREGRWYSTPVYLPADEGRIAAELAIRAVRGENVPSSVNTLDRSPVGESATQATLRSPKGMSFKGQWSN